MQELLFRRGVQKLGITPYNPQANRIVEATMKTLGSALACWEWDSYCGSVAFAYHTSPHASTGKFP